MKPEPSKNHIAVLFRQFAKAVETLTDGQIEDVCSEKASLQLIVRPKQKRASQDELSPDAVELIVVTLKESQTREEADQQLKAHGLSKNALQRILKVLDVTFQREDGIDRLEEKIVDATIGFKLRSKAIQGTQM
jgi:hypothetical protein